MFSWISSGASAVGPGALDQAQDADAGAEALLGMRPRAQDHVDQHGAVGPDAGGFAADTLVRPVAIAAVRAGHVFGHRGRPMRPQAAPMAGDAVAAVIRASTSWRISWCGTL